MKKLICDEVERCQPASLRRKLFHTSFFMYFTFIYSGCIKITSSEEGLKACVYNFFPRKVVLLLIYLFNHDSSTSTIHLSQLIILHHGDKNFLFWHLNQIHIFNNNLNEKGMITSHLMCADFFMINLNVIKAFMLQLFNNNRETLAKTC